MKKLILSLAVITAAISANAQAKTSSSKMDQKLRFSLGAELAAPLGDFKKSSSFGFGVSVQGDYWVDPTFAVTLNAGYINFSGKDYTINYPIIGNVTTKGTSFGIIPVLGGIKYNFTPQIYGSAQLGIGIYNSGGLAGVSNFAYAPGIGYKFTNNFDALLKYQAYSKNSYTRNTLDLRIAYTF